MPPTSLVIAFALLAPLQLLPINYGLLAIFDRILRRRAGKARTPERTRNGKLRRRKLREPLAPGELIGGAATLGLGVPLLAFMAFLAGRFTLYLVGGSELLIVAGGVLAGVGVMAPLTLIVLEVVPEATGRTLRVATAVFMALNMKAMMLTGTFAYLAVNVW